ncbi:hypothetical protein ACOSQ2_031827 [Xanthoceras sorbifolium]
MKLYYKYILKLAHHNSLLLGSSSVVHALHYCKGLFQILYFITFILIYRNRCHFQIENIFYLSTWD